jgi:HEAT repeat protein
MRLKKPTRVVLLILIFAIGFVVVASSILLSRGGADEALKAMALQVAAGDTNAIGTLQTLGPEAVPGLVQLLGYHDRFWRRQIWALAPRVPKRYRAALQAKAGHLEASGVRSAAAKSLAILGSKAEIAVPALLRSLHDPESYVGFDAAAALAKIGSPSVPGLINALKNDDARVRHSAAYALGEMGPQAERAIPTLIQKLADTDPQVRSSSASSLTEIGYPHIAALSNIVDHADAAAREVAVAEFLRFYRAMRTMVPPLIKMAHAEQASSRTQAIEALGAMRAADAATVRTLIAALQDPAAQVRVAALKAFSQIPTRLPTVLNDLTTCLRDSSPEVREWGARLLGLLGPTGSPAMPHLKQLLDDNQASVRIAAKDAISKIAGANETGRQNGHE